MNERLRRLLLVVPAARHKPGIALEELASQLACSADDLRRDIDLLAQVGAPPFAPDDLIDIELRDDRVWVHLAQSLDRPARLTATEAAALVAAVRALAPDDPVAQTAAGKLSQAVSPGQKRLYDALLARMTPGPADGGQMVHRQLDAAIAERREVQIVYFARTELAARPRVVRPRSIAAIDGVRYLSAQRQDAQERLYRLDRIAQATVLDTRFGPLPEIDLEAALLRAVRLEESTELPRARLRFSPEVADAARVRHPSALQSDAGTEAFVPYASLPWLVSYVLSWGGAAELLEPAEARRALAEAVNRALADHAP